MKIKPLTKKQKQAEIESLKKLAKKYKQDAKKRGPKKRVMIPFELEIGNFCCERLHMEFKEGNHEFIILCISGSYIVHLKLKDSCANYCPYCKKHIDEFFYIKEY